MMDVDFLPPQLIILGGSYIGLEFAQIYRRFGSEVSVIETAPRLIAREDEDVSTAVADILRGEGIKTYVSSSVARVAREGNDIAVDVVSERVARGSPDRICSWPSAAPQYRRSRIGNRRHRGRRARLHQG